MGDPAALQHEVDGIEAFGARPNLSPEAPLIHGFAQTFLVDFRDATTPDASLANERYKAIAARHMASPDGGANGIFVRDVEVRRI